ncbi:unnamed protein product [Colias eurytheme]|nr:unnamed protein product [Colias eurytheme]
MPITRSQKNTPQGRQMSSKEDDSRSLQTPTNIAMTTDTLNVQQTAEKKEETSARYYRAMSEKARSVRSTESAARRRRLEAEQEVLQREYEVAQAAARLSRVRLEIAQCDEEIDGSTIDDNEFTTECCENMKKTVVLEEERAANTNLCSLDMKNENVTSKSIEVQTLADALKEVIICTKNNTAASQPNYMHELPFFDGISDEWIAFKTVYDDTAPLFNDVQNMARLRRAIKGRAREAIKSLLYSAAKPNDVIDSLRRRYGRTDALVLAELDKLQALRRITDDPRDVCMFASEINNSVAAIKGLKRPEYLLAPHIVKIILEKLPQSFLYRWYDYIGDEEHSVSDITRVSQWLNREADRCGSHVSLGETNSWRTNRKNVYYSEGNNVTNEHTANYSISESKNTCFHCKKDHVLSECPQFIKLSTHERWDVVKKNRVCFNCLKGKHRKENCRKPPCEKCKRWHHSLLHVDYAVQKRDSDNVPQEPTTNPVNNVCATNMSQAYLKMVEVQVYGPKGSEKIMALLDEGSTVTLLDSSVANRIGASGVKTKLVLQTVGGKNIVNSQSVVLNLKLKGVHSDKVRQINQVCTVDNLKLAPQFLIKERIEQYRHLREFAEQLYYEAKAPLLLIGQDNWRLMESKQIRKGRTGQPVASRTALGWVLHGIDKNNTRSVNVVNTCFYANPGNVKPNFIKQSLKITRGLQVKDYALTTHNNTCNMKFIKRKYEHVTRKGRYKSYSNCSNMSPTKAFRQKVPSQYYMKQKPNVHYGEMNRRVHWPPTQHGNWKYRKFDPDGITIYNNLSRISSIANHRG